MSRSWTIGRKLYAGVGGLVACLIVLAGFLWWQTTSAAARFDEALARAKKVELAADLKMKAYEVYAAEKITILSGYDQDGANLKTWREKRTQAASSFAQTADELTPMFSKASDKALAAKSRQLLDEQVKNGAEVQALNDAGRFHDAQAVSRERNRPLVDATTKTIDEILVAQLEKLKESNTTGDQADAAAKFATLVLAALGLFVSGLVVWVVRGVNASLVAMATELKGGAEQVAAASGQVATAAQGLSQGATEQAASLEETSASMEEMASMTHQTAQNAQQAAKVMGDVDRQMAESNQLLTEMVTSMAAIRESSSKVSKIIKTIDEIAFQTNILALNAAVEAARAGEAGMGFAVVADEVRNLAQRAAQAAKDTASLIEESSQSAQQGSERMERVAGLDRRRDNRREPGQVDRRGSQRRQPAADPGHRAGGTGDLPDGERSPSRLLRPPKRVRRRARSSMARPRPRWASCLSSRSWSGRRRAGAGPGRRRSGPRVAVWCDRSRRRSRLRPRSQHAAVRKTRSRSRARAPLGGSEPGARVS